MLPVDTINKRNKVGATGRNWGDKGGYGKMMFAVTTKQLIAYNQCKKTKALASLCNIHFFEFF